MQFEHLFGGAALIGILAAFWQRIKTLLYRAVSTLIVTIRLEDAVAQAVGVYCWKHFKRSPFGERRYGGKQVFVRPLNRFAQVAYELFGKDPVMFWRGKRPLLVGHTEGQGVPGNDRNLSLTFLRGTWDIERLIVEAIDLFNDRNNPNSKVKTERRHFIKRLKGTGSKLKREQKFNSPQVTGSLINDNQPPSGETPVMREANLEDVRLLRWSLDDVGAPIPLNRRALDALAFPPEVQKVVLEIQQWRDSEEWHREKQIPWRRGWLLYGIPGTGKTSLVRAIAQDLDLPVMVFDLASMSNEELIENWQSMMQRVPCIALIEDIDAVFKGRENIAGEDGGGLTFDCFLNVLGGIEEANGVFLVITTNHVENMDEALGIPQMRNGTVISSRPGRIDRVLELGPMTEECRRSVARRILSDCPHHIDRLVMEGCGDTGAQFQERCSQIAREDFWERKALDAAGTDDQSPSETLALPSLPLAVAS